MWTEVPISISVLHYGIWRVIVCKTELENFKGPKAGPECSGYGGAQIFAMTKLWAHILSGERNGYILCPHENCILKAYAPLRVESKVSAERANIHLLFFSWEINLQRALNAFLLGSSGP
jgi:hypothetical protein